MNWTTEKRYLPYDQWNEAVVNDMKQHAQTSPWHPKYHVHAKHGLLNDPNGFSYFNGEYHLFYQHFPFGAVHGLKSWTHTVSHDLVTFTETGHNITPDGPYETHGVYSGSARQIDDKLFIFYTGNVRDENWNRQTYQLGGYFEKNGAFNRLPHILIEQPDDVTEHFRDPQIFEYAGNLYSIVGGQDLNQKGMIKVYEAIHNNVENWRFIGDLSFKNDYTAYMMECPNLVFVNEHPVLLYCPQGLDKNVFEYRNIYPNLYKIGQTFNPENVSIENISELQQLDYGFETYATQAFNAPDGKVYSISWVGLPDSTYPSDAYHHQGVMSLVKELTIKDGKLYQYPVPALASLRTNPQPLKSMTQTTNSYELEFVLPKDSHSTLTLFANENGDGLDITIDLSNECIHVDRTRAGVPFETQFGTVRNAHLDNAETTINIFIDTSIFEIFINKGEKVFTGRIFPDDNASGIILSGDALNGQYFDIITHGR
ncbi:sucrose-6-phosphate hydrolase [Carnobacteriaceae bacterium zg-ZUI252]|nr:sucrose-6-phosphate hydrolase [Carnobacteriaceae bacterium zg-ZUI252]MBS4769916.1 sucrose-6-phosphate hydrolase [Carnobacteriaceae bacterium zg-ZUI240]